MAFSNKQQINSMENLIQSLTDTKQDILDSDSEITVKSLNVGKIEHVEGVLNEHTTSISELQTSPKWNTTKIVTNGTNYFPSGSGSIATIATNKVFNGGTLVLFISISSWSTVGSTGYIWYIRLRDASNTLQAQIEAPFEFSQAYDHNAWSTQAVLTDIPAGTYKFELVRTDGNLRLNSNDFLNITAIELLN